MSTSPLSHLFQAWVNQLWCRSRTLWSPLQPLTANPSEPLSDSVNGPDDSADDSHKGQRLLPRVVLTQLFGSR